MRYDWLLVAVGVIAGCSDSPTSEPQDAGQDSGGLTSIVVTGEAAPGARVSVGGDECTVPCTLTVAVAGCADIPLTVTRSSAVDDLVVPVADACRSYRELAALPTATMSEIRVKLRRDTASGRCVASPSMILYGAMGQPLMEPLGLDDLPCGAVPAP